MVGVKVLFNNSSGCRPEIQAPMSSLSWGSTDIL